MITTARLTLRRWEPRDVDPWVAMNQDPDVMAYFPALQTREQSTEQVASFNAMLDRHGYTVWATETRDTGTFIGFVGLIHNDMADLASDGVEIGWRLNRAAWGHGYASEGARAALAFGFENIGARQIVAITVPANRRSRAVMERIGMTYAPGEEFDHPRVAAGSPLRRHCVYRLWQDDWQRAVG